MSRIPAMLTVLALLLVSAVGSLGSSTTAGAAPAGPVTAKPASNVVLSANNTTTSSPITVTLESMNPRSPNPNNYAQVVTFVATVTNNTDNTYSDVEVSLQRGYPITRQDLLDQAIRTPPDTSNFEAKPQDLNKQLLPHSQLTVTYKTTPGSDGMCLCYDGVYPYALVARAISDPEQGFVEVGRTQILVPSFQQPPQPVTVGWVWPLLDKPRRAIDENVFTDEALAGEVGPGGRLDRALRVPELLAGKVRLTLLVDPDLLDSLAVMASPTGYRVRTATGTVAGTGGKLAANWLARLRALRADDDVVLTAYADPDVNAVTRAGLSWSTALDPQVQARISQTLDGDFSSDLLNWPVGGALTGPALNTLVSGGASTMLLSDASLPGKNNADPKPDAISPLPAAAGKALALVTDSPIEATVHRALTLGENAANDQQTLLGQLAIRAEQDSSTGHFVVIAPDRYVDTDPTSAAATIAAVVGTGWSKPISLRTALDTVTPVDRGALQTSAENPAAELSQANMASLRTIEQQVASMNEALHDNDAAAQLLGGFSNGIRRAESSGWRADPLNGARLVGSLQNRIDALTAAIHLVQPAVGTYTLSSADSPVVVTVSNQLPKPVTVLVSVTPANGVIGFQAATLAPQTIPANSIETIRVPTHVQRRGKFGVQVTLRTPDGRQLGAPIGLNLRATAIGTVTKIITVLAVAVLALALLRRLVRRIRHGGKPAAGTAMSRPADPVSA